jgi:hypothetical protein
VQIKEILMFRARVKWYKKEKNNVYFPCLMNSKYSRLELDNVTDQEGITIDKKSILEKVRAFYQSLS